MGAITQITLIITGILMLLFALGELGLTRRLLPSAARGPRLVSAAVDDTTFVTATARWSSLACGSRPRSASSVRRRSIWRCSSMWLSSAAWRTAPWFSAPTASGWSLRSPSAGSFFSGESRRSIQRLAGGPRGGVPSHPGHRLRGARSADRVVLVAAIRGTRLTGACRNSPLSQSTACCRHAGAGCSESTSSSSSPWSAPYCSRADWSKRTSAIPRIRRRSSDSNVSGPLAAA